MYHIKKYFWYFFVEVLYMAQIKKWRIFMSVLREKMIQELRLKRMSEKTIKNYVLYVKQLAKYYKRSPDKINREEVKKFLHHLQVEKQLSPNTLNIAYCAIRFFYMNVIQAGWVVNGIARFKRDKSKPVVLDKSEVESILNVTWNLKHKTIFALIYSAGLRVGEAAELKMSHVDTNRMQLFIKGAKGGVDRYAILSPTTLELLQEYIKKYKPVDYLFYAASKDKMKHFSVRAIQRAFQDARFKAQITKEASVHSLRHSFATHLLEAGVNLHHIQLLMGHHSTKTTLIYLHVRRIDLMNIKSPLDTYDYKILNNPTTSGSLYNGNVETS
jgi:integrase/recombinase XerD